MVIMYSGHSQGYSSLYFWYRGHTAVTVQYKGSMCTKDMPKSGSTVACEGKVFTNKKNAEIS
jgi:hypothetical protein